MGRPRAAKVLRFGGIGQPDQGGLVADDSATLWTMLDTAADVIVVAGNAGHELLADLVRIDHLLARDQARSVSCTSSCTRPSYRTRLPGRRSPACTG